MVLVNFFSNPLKTKRDKIFSISLFVLCLMYIFPIILADRYHLDDLGRSIWGGPGWASNDGRPLAEYLMHALLFRSRLINIAPLTQILAIFAFVYASYLYFKSNMLSFSAHTASILMFFCFANPFLLANLSYKFDSLPMVVSMSLLMLPFIDKFPLSIRASILSLFLILASLCFYQATIGFFVCLVLVEFVQTYINNVNSGIIYKLLLIRSLQLLLAFVIYLKLIVPLFPGDRLQAPLLPPSHDSIFYFSTNIRNFWNLFIGYTESLPYISYIIGVLSIISLVVLIKNKLLVCGKVTFWGNVLPSAFIIICPVIAVFASFIHLCFLKLPGVAAWMLISFSGTMFFVAWCAGLLIKTWKYSLLIYLPMILFFMVFSYASGNAIKGQKDYDTFLATHIVQQIRVIDPEARKKVTFYGTQPSSIVRDSVIKNYKTVAYLVPLYMTNGFMWGPVFLSYYGLKNSAGGEVNSKMLHEMCSNKPINQGGDFALFNLSEIIVVAFEKPICEKQ